MQAQVTLKLAGPLDHLRMVWTIGDAMLEPLEFEQDTEGTRYNIQVALQELVTNILRHGYQHDESLPVEVSYRLDGDTLHIELIDYGPPFDPLSFQNPATYRDADRDDAMPSEVGGYGIHIAKVVMDELSYERDGERNVLTLRKCAHVRAAT